MDPPDRGLARHSVRKLLLVLVVLAMVSVTAVLCVLLLAPGATPQEVRGIGPLIIDVRDPQIATRYGILGYIELTWDEPPPQFLFSRGEAWSATMLARFISYSPEITEVDLRLDPGNVGLIYGKYYRTEYGSHQLYLFSSLFSYDPSGTVRLKADEIMPTKVTVQIPATFTQEFTSFSFALPGMESANWHVPLFADAVQPGEVVVT